MKIVKRVSADKVEEVVEGAEPKFRSGVKVWTVENSDDGPWKIFEGVTHAMGGRGKIVVNWGDPWGKLAYSKKDLFYSLKIAERALELETMIETLVKGWKDLEKYNALILERENLSDTIANDTKEESPVKQKLDIVQKSSKVAGVIPDKIKTKVPEEKRKKSAA